MVETVRSRGGPAEVFVGQGDHSALGQDEARQQGDGPRRRKHRGWAWGRGGRRQEMSGRGRVRQSWVAASEAAANCAMRSTANFGSAHAFRPSHRTSSLSLCALSIITSSFLRGHCLPTTQHINHRRHLGMVPESNVGRIFLIEVKTKSQRLHKNKPIPGKKMLSSIFGTMSVQPTQKSFSF